TDDSGRFNFKLQKINSFETGIRIVIVYGIDTIKGPWRFLYSAKNQETTHTFTTADCYARKTTAPTNETYTFDPQTIVVP
ncbi:MAG: hypothetical protein ACHQM6_11235, partial [Candidatus Kapaibacterium sp.]